MKKIKCYFAIGCVVLILLSPIIYVTAGALVISGTLFNPRISPERMDEIFIEDYELLSTVTNFLANLEYKDIFIPYEMMTEMIVSTQVRSDVPISSTRVVMALLALQNQGYWSIGKRNNGVYFQRRVGEYGQTGLIYSLDGNVPVHTIQHMGVIEPLVSNRWFYFETFGVDGQRIDEAGARLHKDKEIYTLIVDYLAEIEYRSVIILESSSNMAVDMAVSNSGRVQIDDDVVNAIEALRGNSYSVIVRNNRTIYFQRWSILGEGSGIAYTIDGYSPTIDFLRQYEQLSKPNWFFYKTD